MPYKAEIYQGKNVNDDRGLPLGYRVVISSLSPCETPQKHHVFFDNFFSSYVLLVKLKGNGFRATCTFRDDRTAQCPLMLKNKMKKEEQGTIDFRSSRDGIELIRWNDNSVVTIGSNTLSVEPIYQCKRWKSGAGQGKVSQPAAIKEYNDGMGGVDLVECVICKKICRNVCMKCKNSVHVKFCFQVLHEK